MRTLLVPFLVLVFAASLPARQRETTVGVTADLVSGSSTPPARVVGEDGTNAFFYGIYPSIAMTSIGARSNLDLSYSFGFDRSDTEPKFQTESHAAAAAFSRDMSARTRLTLAESYRRTTDVTTFDDFRGEPVEPEDFTFVFDPVASDRSAETNQLGFGTQHDLSARSTLEFQGTHTLRRYSDAGVRGLSNQQRAGADVSYRGRLTPRSFWTLGYASSYVFFEELGFEDTTMQGARLGYTAEIAPNLSLRLTGGPSYVLGLEGNENYLGYHVGAILRKTLQNSDFRLYYRQDSGEPSGLGAISDIRRAGIVVTRGGLGFNWDVDVFLFDAQGQLGNPHSTRGVSASATIGHSLTDTLSLHAGGRIRRHTRTALHGYDRERVYLTLRFHDPDLWFFYPSIAVNADRRTMLP